VNQEATSTQEASVPRTIVTTGTSSGFGKLCVERFAAEGRNVAATVRPQEHRPDSTPQ
jgi:NAD(P)-dependent dehydrogenase (short-subunit alcohol dehydrogenase family)